MIFKNLLAYCSVFMLRVLFLLVAECADMWYKMSKDEREKHIRVMRVYLLSPFLFGQVCQEDKVRNTVVIV